MKQNSFKLFLVGVAILMPLKPLRADLLPVCQRTEAVKKNLEETLKKNCDQILPEDLLLVKRVAVGNRNILKFQSGDFSGLANLEILNIRSNPFTELPEGLFKGLTQLNTRVIIGGKIRHYPDDFLADTPNMAFLHLFANPLKSISESVFQRLAKLKGLREVDFDESLGEAEKARLIQLFPVSGTVQFNFN